ncbi:hypothetical protein ACHHYP_12279 [Achlya hypogyna]|uniref:Secreted protein n=1 Tax=Achlya hypogyna TaxID=1202772 RepID=A0A0A7CN38_ACHHY|nr:secreted protein [Achlya hypogyna]OQR85100.1 hypothetical protein ACHHYP_12279 [Achlya hypogyna]
MKSPCLLLATAMAVASAQWTDCSAPAQVAISTAVSSCAASAGITAQYVGLALFQSLQDPASATNQAYCKGQLAGCAALTAVSKESSSNCSYNTYKGAWVNVYTVVPKLCGTTTTAPTTTTTAPTTTTTAPTTTTTAPTTTTTAPTTTTTAPITTTKVPTPTGNSTSNSTTPVITIPPSAKCINVSVVGDATYCVQGPICSGDGILPAGVKCPVKGDVASADCHAHLGSFVSGTTCVLPVSASCQKIPTGAWGCVRTSQ